MILAIMLLVILYLIIIGLIVRFCIDAWKTMPSFAIPINFVLWLIFFYGFIRTPLLNYQGIELSFGCELVAISLVGLLSTVLSRAIFIRRDKKRRTHDWK